jgi:hypothetical protein
MIPAASASDFTTVTNGVYQTTQQLLSECPNDEVYRSVYSLTLPSVKATDRILVMSQFNVTNNTGVNELVGHDLAVNGVRLYGGFGGNVTPLQNSVGMHEHAEQQQDILTGFSGSVQIDVLIYCGTTAQANGLVTIYPNLGYLKATIL